MCVTPSFGILATAELDVEVATICLLAFFALLTIWGITDSANVALLMFATHITTLFVLIGYSIKFAIDNPGIFKDNWDAPFPDITADDYLIAKGSAATALAFGFASSLLGTCPLPLGVQVPALSVAL